MAIMKSQKDIERLRHSGKILASCLDHVKNLARPGLDLNLLNRFAEEFILSYEAKPAFKGQYGYPFSLISEVDEEVVHGLPKPGKLIPEKCVVSFDCGVIFEGVYSDACVLTSFGELSQTEKRLLKTTEESLWAGIEQVKAGKKTGDIGNAVDKVIQREGFGNVLALGGHGLGYSVHDAPHITHAGKPGTGSRLMENQVIAIEPMVTLGSGEVDFVSDSDYDWEVVYSRERVVSAHIEHTLLITKKGCEVITQIDPENILPIQFDTSYLIE